MIKKPIAVICIFFVIGIVLAKFLPDIIKFTHIFTITLILILSSLLFSREHIVLSLTIFPKGKGRIANIFLLLSITLFAVLLYINSNAFPNNHISHFLGEEKINTNIIGIIKGPALVRRPFYGKIFSTYLFEIEAIKDKGEWWGVKGRGQIRIETERDYHYGDRLLVDGTIKRPKGLVIARNEATKQSQEKKRLFRFARNDNYYRDYLERQNIFALINTKENNVSIMTHDYKINPILKYIYSFREKLKKQIIEKMPLETGAFLRAILLGDRSELSKDIQGNFKRSGTMHILAVSGLHVGIVAVMIIYLLRLLRIKRELPYVFTILFLIFFAILTLSRPSVVRAVVMACIFLIGMLLGRRVDVYNSLGCAALFILVRNPKELFNVGFQLSFLAVLSIVYLAPKFMKLIKEDINFYIKRYFYMPLTVSISAWLGTMPLILYYFKIITPIAIVANLFILPILSILLIGGMSFILFGWIGFVGTFLAGFNNLFAHIIFFLADFFASLKFSHFYL